MHREIEVCRSVIFGVIVFLRISKDCMALIRGRIMTVTRFVSVSVVIV